MTEQAVRELIAERARKCGGDRILTRQLGISASHLLNIRAGRVNIGPRVIEALGLEVDYRVKSDGGAIRMQLPRKSTRKHIPMWKFGDWPVEPRVRGGNEE